MQSFVDRRKVSRDPEMNSALTQDSRCANMEHDIVLFGDVMCKFIESSECFHKKYGAYIDIQMIKEQKQAEFWEGRLAKIADGTLWAVLVAVCGAIVFTIKQGFK